MNRIFSSEHRRMLRGFPALVLAIIAGSMPLVGAEAEPGPSLVLTNAQQVLSLGLDQARRLQQPVKIRAVLTMPSRTFCFVQDETAGIYVAPTNPVPVEAPGAIFEIEGVTDTGLFSPIISRARIKVVGRGTVPAPRQIPLARMMAGEGFAQWVRLKGVVRDCNRDTINNRLALLIATEGLNVTVILWPYTRRGLPLELLEAPVEIDGLCWTDVNNQNRPIGFHLVSYGTNSVRVLGPGTTNLLALPLVADATDPRLRTPNDTRIRMTGTVLAHFPDGRIYVQSGTGAVRADVFRPLGRGDPGIEMLERETPSRLEPGDSIDLVGAPVPSPFAPRLVDVEYRRGPRRAPPAPEQTTEKLLVSGALDARLVSVRAKMLSHDVRNLGTLEQEVLTLQNGDLIYEAIWLRDGQNAWPAFPDHALVEAIGVCAVEGETRFSTRRPRLLIRNAGDVRVVGRWSTWQTPQIAKLGAAALGLLLACGVIVVFLRRQVRLRTAELAATNQKLTREIEERRQAEKELDRALMTEREVSELRARFVSMVSHEFRTPLGIIMSAVELLRNYLDRLPAPKRAQLLDDIHGSTRRMSGLMEQVLLLGRVESGRLSFDARPIDVAAICQTLADETRSAVGERCRIDLHFEGEFAGARGDEAMLRHILGNLLSNAVKYSLEEGTVHLRARRFGDAVEFVVEDHGIGIPVSEQPRLFQAFHRCSNVGNTPGTGLGLLIVKRCVELQGGTIELESSPGVGTTFTVRLSIVPSRQAEAA